MTNAFSDYATEFLDDHFAGGSASDEEPLPFLLYLAYTAPHWPLRALPEDIARYKGRYDQGWELLRQQRYKIDASSRSDRLNVCAMSLGHYDRKLERPH